MLLGREPVQASTDDGSDATVHHALVRLDVASGKTSVLDLTTESLRLDVEVAPVMPRD
jgi:hypothetical protein